MPQVPQLRMRADVTNFDFEVHEACLPELLPQGVSVVDQTVFPGSSGPIDDIDRIRAWRLCAGAEAVQLIDCPLHVVAVDGKHGDEARRPVLVVDVLDRRGARGFELTSWIALTTKRRAPDIAGSRS